MYQFLIGTVQPETRIKVEDQNYTVEYQFLIGTVQHNDEEPKVYKNRAYQFLIGTVQHEVKQSK